MALATLDLASVRRSDDDAVDALQSAARDLAAAHAAFVRAVAEVADRSPDPEFAHLEVGTALRLTTRTAQTITDTAWTLVHGLPVVAGLLERGTIDWARARLLARELVHLDDAEARTVLAAIDDVGNLTTGQLGARVRRVLLEADPEAARRRYEEAVADRRVATHARPEGTGDLVLSDLPSDRVHAAMRHLDESARAMRRAGDDRSMDQLRADIACDLLTGGGTAVSTDVTLTISLPALVGLSTEVEAGADLDGWGPVIADVARQVLDRSADGTWTARVLDPDSGLALGDVVTRRRPTAAQARAVRARNPRCVFPGCRAPASRCDLDHVVPYSHGGPTLTCNLAPLCRSHHRARHEGGWSYRLDSTTGTTTWTSPLGRRYGSNPP
ncbi:MAG: DUF222 domain-containing protein [Acidimicrobiia bacterium]